MDTYQPGYRGLIAWQRAMDFAEAVYGGTVAFPADERFGLTSQLRRAAASVPGNIAEGRGKSSRADYARFLEISRGSLYEAETYLLLSGRLGFIEPDALNRLLALSEEVARLLNGLIRGQQRPNP